MTARIPPPNQLGGRSSAAALILDVALDDFEGCAAGRDQAIRGGPEHGLPVKGGGGALQTRGGGSVEGHTDGGQVIRKGRWSGSPLDSSMSPWYFTTIAFAIAFIRRAISAVMRL